jgi:hypothetical protein
VNEESTIYEGTNKTSALERLWVLFDSLAIWRMVPRSPENVRKKPLTAAELFSKLAPREC